MIKAVGFIMKKKFIKRMFFILLAVFVVLALVAGMFLLFWSSLGENPSREQVEYEKRTDAFDGGIFHTPEDFQLIVETEEKLDNKKTELTLEGKIPVNKITKLFGILMKK